ncbi:MAG: fatty-acyl-CoA synthase [Granulosicoccus sp.]
MRITNEDNQVVPIGERGEICTRGYSVMKGYWDDPEQTAQAIDSDGWLHSGGV